jgi:hypothetical protein
MNSQKYKEIYPLKTTLTILRSKAASNEAAVFDIAKLIGDRFFSSNVKFFNLRNELCSRKG